MIKELTRKEMFIIKEKTILDRGILREDAIFLGSNDKVLLKTNGKVIYGLYDPEGNGKFSFKNTELIHFTHDIKRYKLPYVNTSNLSKKEEVLLEYLKVFDEKAKTKLEETRAVINYCCRKFGPAVKQKAQDQNSVLQVPKENINIEIKDSKGEKKMLNNSEFMKFAHSIRKEKVKNGEFEGLNYREQMSIALKLAHKIDKENRAGIKAGELPANAPIIKEKVQEQNTVLQVQKIKEIEKEVCATKTTNNDGFDFYFYTTIIDNKGLSPVAHIMMRDLNTGKEKVFKEITANEFTIDRVFAKELDFIIKAGPKNVAIQGHGTCTFRAMCPSGIKELTEAKNIKLVDPTTYEVKLA